MRNPRSFSRSSKRTGRPTCSRRAPRTRSCTSINRSALARLARIRFVLGRGSPLFVGCFARLDRPGFSGFVGQSRFAGGSSEGTWISGEKSTFQTPISSGTFSRSTYSVAITTTPSESWNCTSAAGKAAACRSVSRKLPIPPSSNGSTKTIAPEDVFDWHAGTASRSASSSRFSLSVMLRKDIDAPTLPQSSTRYAVYLRDRPIPRCR